MTHEHSPSVDFDDQIIIVVRLVVGGFALMHGRALKHRGAASRREGGDVVQRAQNAAAGEPATLIGVADCPMAPESLAICTGSLPPKTKFAITSPVARARLPWSRTSSGVSGLPRHSHARLRMRFRLRGRGVERWPRPVQHAVDGYSGFSISWPSVQILRAPNLGNRDPENHWTLGLVGWARRRILPVNRGGWG